MRCIVSDITWLSESDFSSHREIGTGRGCAEMLVVLAVVEVLAILQVIGVDKIDKIR